MKRPKRPAFINPATIVVAVVCAALLVLAVVSSQPPKSSTNHEAEDSTGAKVIHDDSASGTRAIEFGK